jgi:hypothetical protein
MNQAVPLFSDKVLSADLNASMLTDLSAPFGSLTIVVYF